MKLFLNKRVLLVFIFIAGFLDLNCQNGHTNVRYGLSVSYAGDFPKYGQSIRFLNSSKDLLPMAIEIFGANFSSTEEHVYRWKDVKVKGLGSHLDIEIKYVSWDFQDDPIDGIGKDEWFYIKITRRKKEFLHELKFWNILRLRKRFKHMEENFIRMD